MQTAVTQHVSASQVTFRIITLVCSEAWLVSEAWSVSCRLRLMHMLRACHRISLATPPRPPSRHANATVALQLFQESIQPNGRVLLTATARSPTSPLPVQTFSCLAQALSMNTAV